MKKNVPVTQRELKYDENANILSTTDLKGKITFFNRTFLEISGFEEDELKGAPHNIIRHPDMPREAFKTMWDTIQANRSWIGVVKNRCKNGDHYWVNAFVSPISKNGTIIEYQSVRRNPDRDTVSRADALYKKLINKEDTPELKTGLSLQKRLLLNIISFFAVGITGSVVLPQGWMVAILLLGVGALLYHQVQGIYRPFDDLIAKAEAINDDTVSRYIITGRNDEASKIHMALHVLEAEKKAIIGRVNDAISTLSEVARHLDGSMQSARERGDSLVSEIERVAAAVEEMSATIRDVSDNASKTYQNATSSLEKAQHGKAVIDSNARELDILNTEIEEAADAVKEAATIAGSVTSILDVIKDISEQTRLLSLNATIEAARAGTAGKGFSVVADQVRSLSARTQKSAEEIGQVIENLNASTDKATKMMQNAKAKVSNNSQENSRSVAILDQILASIQGIASGNEEVAFIVEQQRLAADEINQSLSSITAHSHNNMEHIELNTKASSDMSSTINAIRELTNHFWNRKVGKY
ncbi:MAG: PAS domain S-box protein [Bacteroidetes bacterium]|nr:PAS domain S-box protein [Bacteroidota bacterium]MCH8523148.1 methyl-accepting chemotaxis protein [Balneolales bacterium]